MAQHVYHWKHGWIPLTHAAALSKAKGNKDRATTLLQAAHSPEAGIHSRQHVAKALVELPKIDSASGQHDAMQQVKAAAEAHGATDLLPGRPSAVGSTSKALASDVNAGDIVHSPGLRGKVHRLQIDKAHAPKSDGSRNVDVTNLATGSKMTVALEGNGKQHVIERKRK